MVVLKLETMCNYYTSGATKLLENLQEGLKKNKLFIMDLNRKIQFFSQGHFSKDLFIDSVPS